MSWGWAFFFVRVEHGKIPTTFLELACYSLTGTVLFWKVNLGSKKYNFISVAGTV